MGEKKYDLAFLKKVAGDDESFIIDMLETFRSTAPGIVSKMEEYLSQQHFEALGREVHRFIPGITFLGVKDLEEDLVAIEEFTKNNQHLDRLPELVVRVQQNVDLLIEAFIKDFNLKPCS